MKNIIIENIEVAIKFYDSKGANTTTYIFAVSCFHIYKLWKSIFYNEMGKKGKKYLSQKNKIINYNKGGLCHAIPRP